MEHAWSFEGQSVILCDHRGLATCVTYSKIPVAVTRSGLDFPMLTLTTGMRLSVCTENKAMTKISKPCHEIFLVVVCGYGWLPIDPMC